MTISEVIRVEQSSRVYEANLGVVQWVNTLQIFDSGCEFVIAWDLKASDTSKKFRNVFW